MNNKKRIIINSFYLYGRTLILMFVTLYTSRMALISLGVSDFGLYSIINSVIILFSFVQNVFSLSTQRFLTIEISKNDDTKINKTFKCVVLMYLIVCAFVFVLSETFGVWFILSQVKSSTVSTYDIFIVYQISIATLLLQIMQTPFMGYLLASEQMAMFAKIGIFDAFQRWLMVFLFISFYFQNKIIAYSVFLFFGYMSVFILYFYYCSKGISIYNIVFIKGRDSSLLKELFSFTRWPLLGAFSVVSMSQAMAYLAYYFVGLVANASMWLAEQIISAFNRVTGALQMAFTPQIIKNCSNGKVVEAHGLILLSCKVTAYAIILSGIPVFIYADLFIKLWLSEVPPYLPDFIRIAIVFVFIDSFSNPFVTAIYANGDLKRYQIIISLIMTFSVLFMIASLFMGFSIYAAFIIRVLCSLVLLILRVFWVNSIYPLFCFNLSLFKDLIKLMLVAIFSLLICSCMKFDFLGLYNSLIIVSVFNFIFTSVFFFYFIISPNERQSVLQKFRKYI